MKNKILLLMGFSLFFHFALAQDQRGNDWAMQNVREAMQLMDDGMYDKSINLIKEALEIDPNNSSFLYELGLAYCKKGDYKESAKIYEKLAKREDAYDQVFQMLGNVYDIWGKRDKAIKAYEKGIERFPNSGRLYLERSVVHMIENEYELAITTLEKGVSVEPMYPSNYYWLAKIFLENTEDEVWGIIYGELFRHLEPQTSRSAEISNLLYNTYKNEITLKGDSAAVSFSKNVTININIPENGLNDPANLANLLSNALKMSFGVSVYEPTMILSLIGVDQINLKTLNEIRTRFIDLYLEKYYKDHPFVVFDFQKKIKDAGHFEAYNYWLLMYGNEKEYEEWLSNNENVYKIRNFSEWYDDNIGEFSITQENKFIRPK